MKDYKVNGSVYEVTLENGKQVKIATSWVEKTTKLLDTDTEDVLLMWLEDNDYLENEEQEELDKTAKANKVKLVATDKAKKKTPRERVAKPQPEKEFLITNFYELLWALPGVDNIIRENKAKIITFDYKGASYKLDLVQKRKKKEEK